MYTVIFSNLLFYLDDLWAHISQKINEFIYLKVILFPRMAITLWSTKTPGAAQLERDIAVMNNKKKVSVGTHYIHIHWHPSPLSRWSRCWCWWWRSSLWPGCPCSCTMFWVRLSPQLIGERGYVGMNLALNWTFCKLIKELNLICSINSPYTVLSFLIEKNAHLLISLLEG